MYLKKVERGRISSYDDDHVLEHKIDGCLEDGSIRKILDTSYKLEEYEGTWIEAMLYHISPGYWQPTKSEIKGIFRNKVKIPPKNEFVKYIYTSQNLRSFLNELFAIETENGFYLTSDNDSYESGKSYTFPAYIIELLAWYPLNTKILNPKYDDLIRDTLREFIEKLRRLINKKWEEKPILTLDRFNDTYKIEDFIQQISEYSYILDIPYQITEYPFSEDFLRYIYKKILVYELVPIMHLKKENMNTLRNYVKAFVLHRLWQKIQKDPSITLDDIEINSGKYP
ncbi:MAG: hypothetical protein GF311_27030 [Candidatus Lokiarchaeota archaeon]|nr:hypothetical protein [Candidatus Lokiarchaeota archaeon]